MSTQQNLFPNTNPEENPSPLTPHPSSSSLTSHPSPLTFQDEDSLTPHLSPLTLPLKDKDLPPIFREVVTNAPQNRKIPCFIACIAPLCALATRVRLKYHYDTRKSALLVQVIIEAPQSSGKSFAADIEQLLMENTLKLRDKQQRRIEQEYREKKNRRKANEKLDEAPKTTIRVIPATISKTVLTRRADYYERILGDTLTFWMFAEELAQVTDAGKQGYSNLRTIMRTAYDLGSQFGIDFASDNSYSAIVDINICSMFCATPSAVDDYMDKKAIEGGNCSRQILCQLNDDLGADGAIFQPYTEHQLYVINTTLEKMMSDTYDGEGNLLPEINLDTSWIDSTVKRWCRDRGTEALLSGRIAVDVFRKRASVSAFRVAALCYYLYLLDEGGKVRGEGTDSATGENPSSLTHNPSSLTRAKRLSKKIYLFMADYILNALLSRWGFRFEELNSKREEKSNSDQGPTLYDSLSELFTRDQLKALLQQRQKTTPARIFLCQWTKRKLIKPVGNDRYQKIAKTDPYNSLTPHLSPLTPHP